MRSTIYIQCLLTMICLLFAAGVANAEQQGDLPITQSPDSVFSELRTVSGGLCQDLPDDKGTADSLDPYHYEYDRGGVVWCTGPDGETDDLTGCVVQFYDSDWQNQLREETVEPGEYSRPAPEGTAHWQRFNCYEQEYSCTDFESKGCGESGEYKNCDENEMLRVRECSSGAPDSVETERCVSWSSCYNPECQYTVGDWEPCQDGMRERTVTRTDCSTYTEEESCTVSCENPGGEPGDKYCSDAKIQYLCDGDNGVWQRVGTCNEDEAGEVQKNDTIKSVAQELRSTSATAYYSPEKQAVVGTATIKNTGENMVDTHILEMQVKPKGSALQFVSSQKTCDSNHPENVHKQFMLDKGESAEIRLEVPISNLPNGQAKYDVLFMTRHKCASALTQEQMQNYDQYQLVPPFAQSQKIGTVTAGNELVAQGKEAFSGWTLLFIVMMVAGGVLLFVYPYAGVIVLGISATGLMVMLIL